MNTQAQARLQLYMVKIMRAAGVILGIAMVLYALFWGVDQVALPTRQAGAKVVGKGYKAAGVSYFTHVIGNQRIVRPTVTPEYYLLKLDIQGRETHCVVPKSMHDSVQLGDTVQTTYRVRRLTGWTEVVSVRQ